MKKRFKTQDVVYIGLCSALIAICSWISIPATVPFTMQTFAVALTGMLLGGKRGVAAVVVYILLGTAGLPVFSGFRSGIGVLLGTTGGYIVGWIFYVLLSGIAGMYCNKPVKAILINCAGLFACYAFGTLWYAAAYSSDKTIPAILFTCVTPFILPDIIKIVLAFICAKRMKKFGF